MDLCAMPAERRVFLTTCFRFLVFKSSNDVQMLVLYQYLFSDVVNFWHSGFSAVLGTESVNIEVGEVGQKYNCALLLFWNKLSILACS